MNKLTQIEHFNIPEPERKASMVLGILSICLFWFAFFGLIMSIIGLSIPKSNKNPNRDWALNLVGLGLSILFWTIM